MSVCLDCGRKFEYQRSKGCTKNRCNSCQLKGRRERIRKLIYDYKGYACEICGYDKTVRALHFHHLDPSKKDFAIGTAYCRSWVKIKEELDKCILVCANCHAEIHEGQHMRGRSQTVTALF